MATAKNGSQKIEARIGTHRHAEKGGHFAAWEQPTIFAQELRAAFKSLR